MLEAARKSGILFCGSFLRCVVTSGLVRLRRLAYNSFSDNFFALIMAQLE